MKLNYYPETDSLYIDLSEQSSVETREMTKPVLDHCVFGPDRRYADLLELVDY